MLCLRAANTLRPLRFRKLTFQCSRKQKSEKFLGFKFSHIYTLLLCIFFPWPRNTCRSYWAGRGPGQSDRVPVYPAHKWVPTPTIDMIRHQALSSYRRRQRPRQHLERRSFLFVFEDQVRIIFRFPIWDQRVRAAVPELAELGMGA